MSAHDLDARRLLCPMPVIRTQDRIKELADGDELRVFSTDPGALHDIPAWCRVHGHEVLDAIASDDGDIVVRVRIRR
jgi:tRNA 2-thiouridine synthesizing protein A